MRCSQLFLTVLLVCLCTSVMAQSAADLDETDRVPAGGRLYAMASPKYDIGRADLNLRMQRMILALDPSLAHRVGGSAPESTSWTMDPRSSNHPGTASFSAGPDQRLQAVTAWLRSHGLVIEPFHGRRPTLTFTGTVAQVEEAFLVEIHNYVVKGKAIMPMPTAPAFRARSRD